MTRFGRTSRRDLIGSGILLGAVVFLGLFPWRLVAATPPEGNPIDRLVTLADQTPPRARKAFTETLPCGIIVELLDVSDHSSSTKSRWSPDGSPLTQPPHDSPGYPAIAEKQEIVREVTVRLSNLPSEPVGNTWRLDHEERCGWGCGPARPDIRTISLQVPAATKTVNLWLGIAEGPWETRFASDQKDGTLREGASEIDRGVIFSDPIEKAGKGVVVQVAYVAAVDGERRIVAVDDQRREFTASSMTHDIAADVGQLTAVFSDLALNGIKQFRFQSRAYQWIEFRNVSLWPGEQTDVQILQSTTPPRASGVSEAREERRPFDPSRIWFPGEGGLKKGSWDIMLNY